MALGFEVYEDDRDFNQEGLTGVVQRYSTAGMKFPCLVVCATPEQPLKGYTIEVFRKMFPKTKLYSDEIANSMIHVYFAQEGCQTAGLGSIMPSQVKTFLRLFQNNIVEGYLDKDTKLKDMYLYVLAGQ